MPDTQTVIRRLRADYDRLGTWRGVAEKYGVNVAYVYRLARYGQAPTNPAVRKRLGLPPVCPTCGRRLPARPQTRPWRSLSALSNAQLAWLLEHRSPMEDT